MLFEKFDPQSRVWIYQCNRPLTEQEVQEITKVCSDFTAGWTAHDNRLTASSAVLFNRFILFCIDETIAGASGCSIDKSVHLLRELEKKYSIFLFNRLQVAYRSNDAVLACPLNQFLDLYHQGIVNDDTIVFNNLVKTLGELRESWQISVKDSWVAGYLKKEVVQADNKS